MFSVFQIVNEPFNSNSFVIHSKDEGVHAIIDPGALVPSALLNFLAKEKRNNYNVILTHEHFDHISGLLVLCNLFEITLYLTRKCFENLNDPQKNLSKYLEQPNIDSILAKKVFIVEDGQVLDIKNIKFTFYHTPGHSEGGQCIGVLDKFIFTGDTVMEFSKIPTNLPGGNKLSLKKTVDKLTSILPNYELIYPGHGSSYKNKKSNMHSKIWLSSPHIGQNEQKYVDEAFETNWIAPLGPHVNAFEESLQVQTQTKHAAALSSGTSAIHLALILLGVKAGDDVFCQSITFSASANPIVYQGANPVFIDSEADSWNMDPILLRIALVDAKHKGKLPKAIIPVHLYGMPAKMKEILAIASEFNVPVIEDAAEALGSCIDDRPCGSYGDFGVLSFNGNKIITTSGGGALLSNDAKMIEKARFLSTQARDTAPHYQHSHIGYNYRMSNVLAGIGRGQLEVLKNRIDARRTNFKRYISYFSKWNENGFDIKFQEEPTGFFSNRWLTCILVNPKSNKGLTREVIRLTLEDSNIESRPLWKPMHQQPIFKTAKSYLNGISDKLFDEGLCLPSGSNLTEEEFSRIFGCLDNIFSKYQ